MDNVVTGKDFAKLTNVTNRKNSKYFVTLESGEKIHFGNPNYQDFLTHKDEE